MYSISIIIFFSYMPDCHLNSSFNNNKILGACFSPNRHKSTINIQIKYKINFCRNLNVVVRFKQVQIHNVNKFTNLLPHNRIGWLTIKYVFELIFVNVCLCYLLCMPRNSLNVQITKIHIQKREQNQHTYCTFRLSLCFMWICRISYD